MSTLATAGLSFWFIDHATHSGPESIADRLIATDPNGEPETVTIDNSGSNLAALQAINAKRETPIKVRQKKYLNNIVEQDHRAIKRRTRPRMSFKNFRCARIILVEIEIMHMIRKGQMSDGRKTLSPAQQFYSLSA